MLSSKRRALIVCCLASITILVGYFTYHAWRTYAVRNSVEAILSIGGSLERENPYVHLGRPSSETSVGVRLLPFKTPNDIINETMTSINLSGTPAADAHLKMTRVFSSIERLFLAGTRISDDGLQYLRNDWNLRELDLSDTAISDEGIKHLYYFHSLKQIDLSNTHATIAGISELEKALPDVIVRTSSPK